MASVSDEAPSTQGSEVESSPSENQLPAENEEVKQVDTPQSTKAEEDKKEQVEEEEQKQPSASITIEPAEESQPAKPSSTTSDVQEEKQSTSSLSKEVNKENVDSKSQKQEPSTSKSRTVNFASTVDNVDVPKSRSTNSTNTRSLYSSSSKSSHRPVDFIDTLVESYKLETNNPSPTKEEKKYVPKTNRSRLNPNWREHRTRRLMNKLEELSLWDREEELKAAQAQALREQKWEQIQDRQRNNDLCLNLMRQRHESEMESAVTLDRAATGINDENTTATIARAMTLASANTLAYDLPIPPQKLKRRAKQEQEKSTELKTPLGRYRQFETNMDNKLEKINQKLQPDREIMRAYSPYRTSIPPTAVPLFSETYSALLSIPDVSPSNKYSQYHYGVASYLHQPQHAPSPDYETRLRSYSNRDVRVPLKEQANDYSYYDDDNTDEYNRSNLIDDNRHTKYRSVPLDDDYRPRYRSNPIDDDYHPRYRANPIDDDYYPKYRSTQIDDDYPPKYRSTQIDDDYPPKYRSIPIDEDYYSKYRSTPIEDDYYTKYRSTLTSRLDYSPPRRTTALASPTASALYDTTTVANSPRDFSFLHARQPISNSIHLRSLNDDLNAITRFSTETSRKILQNIGDSPNDSLKKNRSSSSIQSTKHTSFNNRDVDDENINYNSSRNYSSKTMYQPVEILSLSSTR